MRAIVVMLVILLLGLCAFLMVTSFTYATQGIPFIDGYVQGLSAYA